MLCCGCPLMRILFEPEDDSPVEPPARASQGRRVLSASPRCRSPYARSVSLSRSSPAPFHLPNIILSSIAVCTADCHLMFLRELVSKHLIDASISAPFAACHQHTQLTSFRQQSQLAATIRLGCQDLLPVVRGRYRQVPRPQQRLRRHSPADCVGRDEKHLIFECSVLDHIRHQFSVPFLGHHSFRSFMNQDSQRDVLHFVCDCLDYYIFSNDRCRCCRRPSQ